MIRKKIRRMYTSTLGVVEIFWKKLRQEMVNMKIFE